MNYIKHILTFLLCFALTVALCGCGGHNDAHIYFELNDKPVTLDAQTASTNSELLIVRNTYEGLLRKNADGKIVCGTAESYEKKGLTYTFKIRDNALWSDGTPLTADDYVFAFRRAVQSKTKAPFARRLFSIKNAKSVYNWGASSSSLGVTASDTKTLIIELSEEDENFENTLTTSVAMPCNEKFFNDSIGKYGLERQYTLSNGSYYIGKWNIDAEDFGIRLYKNEEYNGEFKANNGAIFLSCNNKETPIQLLKDGSTDIAIIGNQYINETKSGGLKVTSYQNICWVMTIGKEYTADIRRALTSAISEDVYKNSLITGFLPAHSLFPQVLGVSSETENVGLNTYNINQAKQLFTAAVKNMDNDRFPSATLYYYDDGNMKSAITDIVGHWQQNLSAFINIKPVNDVTNVLPELTDQSLSFAVFPVNCSSTDIREYLLNYGIDYHGLPAEIQKSLVSDNRIVPIAFENTNIVSASTITGMFTEPENGYIDFSFIIKSE